MLNLNYNARTTLYNLNNKSFKKAYCINKKKSPRTMNGDVCLVGVGRAKLVGDDTLEVTHVSLLDVPEVQVGGEIVDPPPITQVTHLLGAVHPLSQHLLKRSHQLVLTLPNTLNMVFLMLLNKGLMWF